MSTDFKVIGISDAGTSIRFGGDDLDKINNILNGTDLSLDILIDNEWSFKHNKLVIRDFTGSNKIKIGTSTEAADWSITIPVLGGNRTPVFTDLTQELTNKDIDGGENTFTNIPDSALSDNVPLLDAANTFTALQQIELDADTLIELYRNNATIGEQIGIDFDAQNDTSQRVNYGRLFVNIQDPTTDSENGHLYVQLMADGVLSTRLFLHNNGNLFVGANQRLVFSESGQTSAHVMTFPDETTLLVGTSDARLTDSRTPTSHATTHLDNGTDDIPVATTLRTGLLPILSNTVTEYLDGTGNWSTPSAGSIDNLNDVDTASDPPSNNDVLTWDDANSEWVPAAPPGASGGEANTLTNVGSEAELVKAKVSVNYDIRTLAAGSNVTITQNTDTITIAATDTNTVTDALTELTTDVLIATPSDLQVLAYDNATSKWKNNSFNSERTGTATGSGDGSATTFNVPHGLGDIPYADFIQCKSHSNAFTYSSDDTNITVEFDVAPGSGTDNVEFSWRVVG